MKRDLFRNFFDELRRAGAGGINAPQFSLGQAGAYELRYIPFEYVNHHAKLVIVGITPGNTQLSLAYGKAQELLRQGHPTDLILREVKKVGAFGGPSMRPNLLKMLRHFRFEHLLGIADVESLWGSDADLLHSTSVVPHAAFKNGKMFSGRFDEVLASPLLRECFHDCFVPSVEEMKSEALFVGLGPCPEAALEWCVQQGALRRNQVLGSFCHPSSAGGSTTRYYLREVAKHELGANNPVLRRTEWLDRAYDRMHASTSALLGGTAPKAPVRNEASVMSSSDEASLTKVTPVARQGRDTAKPRAVCDDVAVILAEVRKAGFRQTKETLKLAEFEAPCGQVVYVVKTTSTMNRINVMVHPALKREAMSALPGVASVSDNYRFHSNMTRFPKRINGGATEIAHGWQVSLDTFGDLPRFLTAFDRTGVD
ncbi:hypothetical protein [Caballeronia sp. J97]|uniref:hypothetical protein n=1 Tax=Caballeronia sp. J97 TaxID=2805429 RepID=UPI002AB1AFDF|nr:hypothetical protein [Caballeronia sp. J97]